MTAFRSTRVVDREDGGLRRGVARAVWPSKIYGIEAAGRPWIRLCPGLEVEDLREAARCTPRPRAGRPGLEGWAGLLGAAPTPARSAAAVEA